MSSLRLKLFLFFFSFSCYSLQLWAQQGLIPLTANQHQQALHKAAQESKQHARQKSAQADTIQVDVLNDRVIFLDDFSDYAGWPHQSRWQDRDAYINYSFGHNPVTMGVATFDGLDSTGKPYNSIDPFAYGENDQLTSCPINLSSINLANPNIDSVYMSFYYQPQGTNPFGTEEGDSLILEFHNPETQQWQQVWSADGAIRYAFRKKTLFIDTAYYKNGFRFRFTNFGNQSGSVDHWHIDYVYISSNLLIDHANPEDMALRHKQFTLLKDYTAVPWWHYSTDQMREEVDLDYYYFNNKKPKSGDVKSWLEISDRDGNQLLLTNTTFPEFTLGFLKDKRINWKFSSSGPVAFPEASSEQVNFFNYKFYYSFNNFAADSNSANDTIKEQQLFGSYYAYDDGMAEAGYGVFGSGNQLAYGFDIGSNVDTLRALNIYFNPVIYDRSRERFKIAIWSEKNGRPDALVYQNTRVDRPKYSELNQFKGVANFVRYEFDIPLVLTGKFFVGWVKLSDDRMNVGYDVNRDFQKKIFVNIGSGWQVSDSSGGVVPGCLMIRPAFRNLEDPVLGVADPDVQPNELKVYPNPASGQVQIESPDGKEGSRMEMINIQGKTVLQTMLNKREKIDVSMLPRGLYFIRAWTPDGAAYRIEKLVIQ
jgi:hypothetical protein